jgi:hypothetical protein
MGRKRETEHRTRLSEVDDALLSAVFGAQQALGGPSLVGGDESFL